jgi:2,3-bisphosphoglycerate-independent phosphoglycerate mutase
MPRRVPGPVVLLILDGVASHDPHPGNAVTRANPEFLSSIWESYPHGLLYAAAEYVGLPKYVKGNSEVGHTNIGAGKVVFQYLPRINQAIEKRLFHSNQAISTVIDTVKARGTALHLLLCVSDGDVHSTIKHLKPTLEMCKEHGLTQNVFIHAFTDGRDSPQRSADQYLTQVEEWLTQYGIGKIATVIGRQYAMDRNKTWDRTKKAYDLLTGHVGTQKPHWKDVLADSYANNIGDEFVEPYVIQDPDVAAQGYIKSNDGIFFLNIRPDRAVQLTEALTMPTFIGFQRERIPLNIVMATMVRYRKDFPVSVAFPPADVTMPLGRVVSMAGMRQLRLSESQKFPHVTYFVNGGNNIVYPGELRINIPSPDVPTFDVVPEMSIYKVLDTFMHELSLNIFDLFIINFANGDMVGHTGVIDAGVMAVKHVDYCASIIVKNVLAKNGVVFVTADHGNVDEMIDLESGQVSTEHSIFPVPFVAVYKNARPYEFPIGQLSDIAPTVLDFLGLEAPPDMSGRVLIDKNAVF